MSNPQISPDGARIVYTRQQANKIEDRWDSSLWIMNADGSQHRFLTKGSNPRWSSDGKRILYIADGEPRGPQIFVRWIDTDGPATQVTHATEKVADARWSPDGKSIAFSMFVPEKDTWNVSMPAAPQGAHWTAAPRVVESLHYRQDQVGFLEDGHTHLFVVAADGGAPRQITSGKWSVGAGELRGAVPMDWTPDSKAIVFEADRSADADLHYQISQLLVADIASGAIRELVAKPGSWSRPAVSPDGKTVAFTGYPQSKRTHSVADLYVVPFAGGEMRKISGDFDRDPVTLRWSPDSSGVYFDADDHGSRNVQFAATGGRRREGGHHRRARAHHGFRLQRHDRGGHHDRSRESARRGALQPAPRRANPRSSPTSTRACWPASTWRRPRRSTSPPAATRRYRAGS